MNKTFIFLFLAFSILLRSHTPSIIFKENKGQWPEKVLFGANFLNTQFYVNKNGFNYCVYSSSDLKAEAEWHHSSGNEKSSIKKGFVRGHNYEVSFIGATFNAVKKNGETPESYNYFLGNDRSKWASHVKAYTELLFTNIYEGADLKVRGSSNLKYDVIIKPFADPAAIQLNYSYTYGLELRNGDLLVKTSIGTITEKAPHVYQVVNGKEKRVKCNYVLVSDTTVTFSFPEGYDKARELIIDPAVIVCSYSNNKTMSYGCSAGYDVSGNIYNASCSRENYPFTTGAFQQTYMGDFDLVISAYNSTGSAKIFSTYLGGDSLEYAPQISVINGEIILLGTTYSYNFPCTASAFDNTLNGKGDFFISKLDLSGSNLLASTLVGGSMDESGWNVNPLGMNVWDSNRNSEFVADAAGNIYVAGLSKSPDFPVTSGALSTTLNGISDACIFKIDKTLSTMIWCTYLGGSRDEVGKSIRLDGSGGVYCLGSTTSTNFPTTSGVIAPNKISLSFISDMFISHINSNGTGLISSTYLGTSGPDYGCYMDLDAADNVYLCGHFSSTSQLVPTPGLYNNPNGMNAIYKLDSSLSVILFKTKFGNPVTSINPPQVPYLTYSAFKVDSCSNIYIAGYGYNVFPTTSNSIQGFGGGITDAYMAVFGPDCTSLKFASYFGGSVSHYNIGEHNDHSSNAFDNKGRLYMSLCSDGGLPTTAMAFEPTFISSGDSIYNDAFVKVDLGTFVNAGSSYGANITGCPPFTPTFVSTTNTGTSYWDLGNGVTSTLDTISTTYTNLGNYNVLLVVTDTNTCNRIDSIKSILNVISPTDFDLGEDIPSCANTKALILSNVTAVTYSWSTGQTTQNIFAFPGSYTLTINNGGCSTSDSVHVVVAEKKLSERFPNVVTANGDGVNDFIELKKYDFQEVELIIYDRWGREVFKTNDPVSEWHPDDLRAGTYFYVASYLSSCIGKYATDKGFISVFK